MPPLLRGKSERPYPLAPAPHLHALSSVQKLLWGTIAALLPLWVSAWVIFGWDAPRVVLFSIGFGILWESLFQLSRKSKINIANGSTVLASFLFALFMPPSVSIPLIGLGTFFAIILAKEIFGGLGQNIFHPALVGYAVLVTLFPDAFALHDTTGGSGFKSFFLNPEAQVLCGTSAAAILLGALALAFKRWIAFRHALLYLMTVAFGSFLLGRPAAPEALNGPIVFCAFFFVTDFVTTPVTREARNIFAAAAGALTVLLRSWFHPLEAFLFSILLSNALTPLLDSLSRSYAGVRREE